MDRQFKVIERRCMGGAATRNTECQLYQTVVPPGVPPLPPGVNPLGTEVGRVVTEWTTASGWDLKQRAVPIKVLSTTPSIPAHR
jgi:hypothetical protein